MKPYKYAYNLSVYAWAAPECGKADVVDLGCGIGLGMQIVSVVSKSIKGVDRDLDQGGRPSLIKAKQKQYYCPVEFIVRDLEKEQINLPCDVCLAFEILEHLEDPNFVLKQIPSMCKKFIFSVPLEYGTTLGHKQIYHTIDDVKKLIEPYFSKVEWFYLRKSYIQKAPFNPTQRILGICSN